MSKHLIFVYGTLKHGWGNNAIIHDQRYLGEFTTDDNHFQMYSLGGYPGVVSGNFNVRGEVWEVDDKALARCDHLEGHPDFYKREQIKVYAMLEQDFIEHIAWIYIYQGSVEGRQPIEEWVH